MKPTAARLLLVLVLFIGWLGYLGYLVLCRPHTPDGLRGAFEGRPLALSRPQFLVSMVDVVAEVHDASGENVLVKEILFPAKSPLQVGDKIHVENLDQCRPLPDPMAKTKETPPDYSGPGEYILPLNVIEKDGARHYQVTPTPPSPGFPPMQSGSVGPPRIYPHTPEMRAEYDQVRKPR
jgi:hypothetical protein